MYGALIITEDDIRNLPLEFFITKANEILESMRILTDYKYANKHIKFSNIYGNLFSISIYRSGAVRGSIAFKEYQREFGQNIKPGDIWEICTWNDAGAKSVYGDIFIAESNKPLPEKIIEKVKKLTKRYSEGFIRCSDCKTEIKKEEVAGHYFAGVYCNKCWNGNGGKYENKGGWKEIESKENYE